MALVTVVVPCFNAESFISPTLFSVRNQVLEDFECIIVDDCSTDNSLAVIENFVGNDKRFKIISLASNSGVVHARNTALLSSSGRYVAFLDSDDLWAPSFLVDSLNAHEKHCGGLVHSPYYRFKVVSDGFASLLVEPPAVIDIKNIYHKNYFPLLTTVCDRQIVGDISFPSRRPEDYALWVSLLGEGMHSSVSSLMPNAFYRVSQQQRSANKIAAFKRLYHFYAGFLGFPSIVSLPLTVRWSLLNLLQRRERFVRAKGNVLDELSALHSPWC